MIKSFVWTFVFWTLFVLFNSVGDAIDFYKVFPWYGNMALWHFLKYFWIGFAVLTGVFSCKLYWAVLRHDITKKPLKANIPKLKNKVVVITFLLLWFLLFRWILHETLMWIWRQP